MKKKITIEERAYFEQQQAIMNEMQSILNRRTSTNGRQIVEELEALQRRAYPEFYRNEPQPIRKPDAVKAQPEQTAAAQEDPEQDAEPRKLNAIQIAQGLYYFISQPIRHARKHSKARK